jgi:hypothetical protein
MSLEPNAKRHAADDAPFLSACPVGGFWIGALSILLHTQQQSSPLG